MPEPAPNLDLTSTPTGTDLLLGVQEWQAARQPYFVEPEWTFSDVHAPNISQLAVAPLPNEAELINMATEAPEQLLTLIRTHGLQRGLLARACEAAALVVDEGAARAALLDVLVNHPEPIIREAAVYGLSELVDEATATAMRELLDAGGLPRALRETLEEALADD